MNRKIEAGERFTSPPGSQQRFTQNNEINAEIPTQSMPSTSAAIPTQPVMKKSGVLIGNPPNGTLRNQEFCTINVLTPYFTSHVLKCKVKSKAEIKNWSNAKGKYGNL